MSVVTDTTNHESGSRAIRESPLREVGWGHCLHNHAAGGRLRELDSRLRGNDGRGGRATIFRGIARVGWSPTPISMKMGAERRTGNHKGCPYDRFAGGYFQSNAAVTDIPARHHAGGVRLLRANGVFLAPSRNRLCRHGTGRGTGEARGSAVGHPASARSAALAGPDSLARNEDFCVPGSRCPRSSRV